MATDQTNFSLLTEAIIRNDSCVRCGACLSLCPYLTLYQGTIVFPDTCVLQEGRCVNFCPKGPLNLPEIHRQAFDEDYEGAPLGTYRKIVMARTVRPADGAQYGGVVTALVSAALERGTAAGAVLTRWRNRDFPEGIIVQDPGDISLYGGSHYAGGYALSTLNHHRKSDASPLVVVGLPCQMLAMRRMHGLEHPQNVHKGAGDLLIGLFCTWSLTPRPFLEEMTRRFGRRRVRKYDIPPPPANRFDIVFEDGETVSFPLEEIRPLLNPGCEDCLDMTSEFAEISVGAAEGIPGWNTVILRSRRGETLFDSLVQEGTLETKEIPEGSLRHLTEAAALKKRRALKVLGEKRDPEAWIGLSPRLQEAIKNVWTSGES